jgi:hypothetical protein
MFLSGFEEVVYAATTHTVHGKSLYAGLEFRLMLGGGMHVAYRN